VAKRRKSARSTEAQASAPPSPPPSHSPPPTPRPPPNPSPPRSPRYGAPPKDDDSVAGLAKVVAKEVARGVRKRLSKFLKR
jgi:hypothetical protein